MANQMMEEGTRMAEFLRALNYEGKDYNGLLKAGVAARDVTLDFQRFGWAMKGLNQIVAFQNVQVQALDKLRRDLGHRPWITLLNLLIGTTIPSILIWFSQKDDPAFQELPLWRRVWFWNFVTHNDDGTVKNVWSIPRPWERGVIFGSIPELFLEYCWTQNKDEFDEIVWEILKGLIPPVIPTFFLPFMELWGNKSYFFGRPLVPKGMEKLPPELQYSPWTSETVKVVGRTLNISPLKLQSWIRNWTGAAGYLTLDSIDELLKEFHLIDIPAPPIKRMVEWPLIRAFHHRFPTAHTRSIHRFYNRLRKLEGEWAAMRQKAGIRGLGVDLPVPTNLQEHRATAHKIQMLRALTNVIHDSPNLSGEEKRRTMDVLYFSMINTARLQIGKNPLRIPQLKKRLQ